MNVQKQVLKLHNYLTGCYPLPRRGQGENVFGLFCIKPPLGVSGPAFCIKPPLGVWGPWLLIFMLLTSTTHAQKSIDSTKVQSTIDTQTGDKPDGKKAKGKKKEKATEAEAPKTDETATDTKTKGKKKGKGKAEEPTVKLDSASTREDSIKAALPKALRNAKPEKKESAKKTNSKKPEKAEPKHPEPKIIPGAEAKANAEVKDKQDRTLKGPSGQKVYSSPKGGKYYIDVNGNKKYLKRDIPDAK